MRGFYRVFLFSTGEEMNSEEINQAHEKFYITKLYKSKAYQKSKVKVLQVN